jgi:hypothetical protein
MSKARQGGFVGLKSLGMLAVARRKVRSVPDHGCMSGPVLTLAEDEDVDGSLAFIDAGMGAEKT